MRFEGKRALVTGAGRGIGQAIALKLKQEGAEVTNLDLQPSESCHHNLLFDLSQPQNLPNLLAQLDFDLVVHGAAICPTQSWKDSCPETWQKVMAINVIAPAEITRILSTRMMERNSGRILALASVSSFLPKPDQVEYGASKAALVSLVRTWAAVLGPYQICVNGLAPGLIDSPLTEEIAAQRGAAPQAERVPLGRLGTMQEVADAALWLLSDEAGYINGQIIGIDGGFLMR